MSALNQATPRPRAHDVGSLGPQAQRPFSDTPADANAELLALKTLLSVEQRTRDVQDLSPLRHFIVNETRKLNAARQIFLVEAEGAGRNRVAAISGLSTFDPSSVLVDDVAKMVAALSADRGTLGEAVAFSLPAYAAETTELGKSYPFREVLWVPLTNKQSGVFAGLVCLRETVWTSPDIAITTRLASSYAYAWRSLSPRSTRATMLDVLKRRRTVLLILMGLALLVPVPIIALAPAEIVGRDREIVAAPIDGVVETIAVDPSSPVKAGQVIATMADISLRNRRDIAAQEKTVAEARMKQASLLAFSDPKGRFELAIAQAELDLKQAELSFANEQLARTSIRAPRDGVVVFADKRSLTGKPVSMGERLMEIVDPADVEVRIDLAAADAIALGEKSRAKVFLDIEPLSPRQSRIARADHRARPSDADVLSFRAFATLEGDQTPPRIGLRGTAQVMGDYAPLAFVLFRRPIAATRQWLGL